MGNLFFTVKSYRTDRSTTSAIGGWLSQWQEPRIPYALPRNTLEITEGKINRSRIVDGDDTHIRQCMGETLRSRRNNWVGNAAWAWPKPIMDCSDEDAVRKAIEQDRQSMKKAKEAWQQASGKKVSESTFRAFLSALARDIDV